MISMRLFARLIKSSLFRSSWYVNDTSDTSSYNFIKILLYHVFPSIFSTEYPGVCFPIFPTEYGEWFSIHCALRDISTPCCFINYNLLTSWHTYWHPCACPNHVNVFSLFLYVTGATSNFFGHLFLVLSFSILPLIYLNILICYTLSCFKNVVS